MTKNEIRENIKVIQEEKKGDLLRRSIESLKTEVMRWCAVALVHNQMKLEEIRRNGYETL